MKKKKKAFTLLELMIVVIILGILVGIALPRFLSATQRARLGAASAILASIRGGQIRYYAEYRVYTNNILNLDVDLSPADDWTINAAAPPGVLGDITHVPTSTGYRIDEGGTVSEY